MIMGVITAFLMVLFLGIVAWAYSAKRSGEFADAARLPLQDDRSESDR